MGGLYYNSKHAKVITKVESFEAAAKATTDKAEATGKLAELARQVDKLVADLLDFGKRPDQEDLAILVLLDKLVRDMEAEHDAEAHGAIESSEGPSAT